MDKDELHDWLYLANMDIDSALLLKQMRPQHKEIIGFHCQQSAEKYLKAFLFSHGETPPKTHDLITLCRMCTAFDSTFQALESAVAFLTAFGVQPRYPHELNITDGAIVKALQFAEQVSNFPVILALRNKYI
ncbi:HEPN domain-containing protein [Bacteroidia bacterium]|nr:HEPN domain-containing protein [Bacteroidia bacterium]